MSSQAVGDAFANSPYKGETLLVHLAIADVANDMHGYRLWMTRPALAKKSRASVATVARAQARMIEDGWLEVVTPGGGRGQATEYRYLMGGKPSQGETVIEKPSQSGAETVSTGDASPLIELKEPNPDSGDVTRVFDAWVDATAKTGRTRLDDKRRKLINAALRAYPVEDVIDAVRGWQHSPYHCGKNERRTVYNDLALLLRDAAHIEKFRDLQRRSHAVHDPRGLNADRNVV